MDESISDFCTKLIKIYECVLLFCRAGVDQERFIISFIPFVRKL
jgi:hypothetical protein